MKFAAFILAFGAVASAHALVLDDFTSGPASIETYGGTTFYDQAGTMAGGFRLEQLEIDSNPFNVGLDVEIGNGFSSFSSGPGLVGQPGIGYGYLASADNQTFSTFDMGLDLSAQSAFELDFAFNQTAMTGELLVNQTQVVDFAVAGSMSPQSVMIDFSGFSGVDWSDVHQLAIVFADPASNDFTLDEFQATPEPASAALLGLGALGLLARRRRR